MKKPIFAIFLFYLTLLSVTLFILSIDCMAAGITARFSWQPNQEENVTGYRLYYSTKSRRYNLKNSIAIDNPQPRNGRIYGEIPGLIVGTTYYFVVTAHDDQGAESEYSQEIQWTAAVITSQRPPTPRIISVRTIN